MNIHKTLIFDELNSSASSFYRKYENYTKRKEKQNHQKYGKS